MSTDDNTKGDYWRDLEGLQKRVESLERALSGLGGLAGFTQVGAQESTTADPFVDLATNGPSVIVPSSGDYVVDAGFGTYVSSGAAVTFGGVLVDADVVLSIQSNLSGTFQIDHPSSSTEVIGLAAGSIVRLRYGAFTGCTAEFFSRWIRITKLPS